MAEKKKLENVNKVSVKKDKKESSYNSKIEMIYEVLDAYKLDADDMKKDLETMSGIVNRLRIRAGL
jgi:hypothetical protein